MNTEIKDFLTIRKKVYNFWLDRTVEKVYRFYKGKITPPTIWYTFDPRNCKPLSPIQKTLWLKLNDIPEEVKVRFAENIVIQEQVMDMIKKRDKEFNYRCWLIRLTTWKWKSHVIMDIANYYQAPTLVLVHNIKTLKEMVAKFKEFTNITPAQYWWGKKEIWDITICTKRSFWTDFEHFVKNFELILIDEAPVQFSKKLWDAINTYSYWKEGIALYWLSWTPYKNDLNQADLERYFWLTIEIKWQANNWYNIIPQFMMFDYFSHKRYLFETPAEMRTALAEDMDRLLVQVEKVEDFMDTRNCLLILTDRVQEVENIEAKIRERGVPADFMFTMVWNTKKSEDELEEENMKTANEIISRWWQVIIIGTIQKLAIWVDIPYIDTVLLASAIKFKATVVQAIWRWLRKHKSKTDVLVWVWNDMPILKKQRSEKIKSIKQEYLISESDLITIKL